MSKSSFFVAFLLVMILAAAGTTPALAQPPVNTHEQVIEGNVDWTLPPGQCPAVPDGLAGSGERHKIINTRTNPDGSTVTTINDVVKGEAWDATGNYKFTYVNHSVEVAPAGGGPRQVSMVDNFVVNGKGIVGHLEVGFNWRWTYTPPAEQWPPVDNWVQLSTRGEPALCDPI